MSDAKGSAAASLEKGRGSQRSLSTRVVGVLKGLFSRYPADPRVVLLRSALKDGCARPEAPRGVVAVEGLEDPFYFALLSALVAEINRNAPVRGELLLVHSISGAIGTDLRARLLRSWPFRTLISQQWIRAFRPIVAGVAYRSVSLRHPVGDALDLLRSALLWRRLRRAEFLVNVRGIRVDDLIIDSNMRFRPAPRFDKHDPFVIRLIWQAHRDVRRCTAYMRRRRPAMYLTSYSTYIEHGVPVRVALNEGVRVRSFGSLSQVGKELVPNDWFHTPFTGGYRRDFERLSDREARLAEAERGLGGRLSGEIDSAMSYMRVSAYGGTDRDVALPDLRGAVVIFLHDFYDSPHVYSDLVFDDFWSWVCFTIDTLTAAGIPFILKPHPNQISLSSDVLRMLTATYPDVRFLPPSVSNVRLRDAGIACGVTMYGSVAHELAYLGIPSIGCANHPHNAFDFCRTARTREQYAELLRNATTADLDTPGSRRQSLAFYYMHNLYGSPQDLDLRSRFVAFWKACQSGDRGPDLVDSLDALRRCAGFRQLGRDLAGDIAATVPQGTRHLTGQGI